MGTAVAVGTGDGVAVGGTAVGAGDASLSATTAVAVGSITSMTGAAKAVGSPKRASISSGCTTVGKIATSCLGEAMASSGSGSQRAA